MGINIKQELKEVWPEILEINALMSFLEVGPTLKDELQKRIRPIIPPCLGYSFIFNHFGEAKHIFYEIGNENNSMII